MDTREDIEQVGEDSYVKKEEKIKKKKFGVCKM